MNLDETQKQEVAKWINEGLKLSEIQSKLATEYGLRVTYMEVRLLVDDLKLTPKNEVRRIEPILTSAPVPPAATPVTATPGTAEKPAAKPGKVSVAVDSVARAGAVVSGRVTFSDGNSAEWYLDQMGRLGLAPGLQGYRPSQEDLEAFQTELHKELSKMGF